MELFKLFPPADGWHVRLGLLTKRINKQQKLQNQVITDQQRLGSFLARAIMCLRWQCDKNICGRKLKSLFPLFLALVELSECTRYTMARI